MKMRSKLALLALLAPSTAAAVPPAALALTAAEIALFEAVVPAGALLTVSDSALILEHLAAEYIRQQGVINAAAGMGAESGGTAAVGRFAAQVAASHQQVILKAGAFLQKSEELGLLISSRVGNQLLGLLIIDAGQYDSVLGVTPENQWTSIMTSGEGIASIMYLSYDSESFYAEHGFGNGGGGGGGSAPNTGEGSETDNEPQAREVEWNTDTDTDTETETGGGQEDGDGWFFSDAGGDEWAAGCVVKPDFGRHTQLSAAVHDAAQEQIDELVTLAADHDRVYIMSVSEASGELGYSAAWVIGPSGGNAAVSCGHTALVDADYVALDRIAAGDMAGIEDAPAYLAEDAAEALNLIEQPYFGSEGIQPGDLEAAHR